MMNSKLAGIVTLYPSSYFIPWQTKQSVWTTFITFATTITIGSVEPIQQQVAIFPLNPRSNLQLQAVPTLGSADCH